MDEKVVEILEDIAEMLEDKLTAIDWKLWEIYKIAKTQHGGIVREDNDEDEEVPTSRRRPARRRA